MIKFLIICVLIFSSISPVYAFESCEPKEALLSQPAADETKKCLQSIWFSLGRHIEIDTNFTHSFIQALLPTSESQQKKLKQLKQFDIDYLKLVDTISLLGSEKLIKSYMDFIVFTSGSADELRTFGLGKLYSLQAPVVLKILSSFTPKEQKAIIRSLAWGLANNYYPHINKNNYQRLIIGEHWELIDNKHPQRELTKRVESDVYHILESYQ